MVFEHDGVRVTLSEEALRTLAIFRQTDRRLPEAGGLLFGRFMGGGSVLNVDAVSVPMPADRRRRRSFSWRDKGHIAHMRFLWRNSGGTVGYLGDWHSHPEEHPEPSSADFGGWSAQMHQPWIDIPHIAYAIVGTESIGVWVAYRKEGLIAPAHEVLATHPWSTYGRSLGPVERSNASRVVPSELGPRAAWTPRRR